jgi:hypothetical protein
VPVISRENGLVRAAAQHRADQRARRPYPRYRVTQGIQVRVGSYSIEHADRLCVDIQVRVGSLTGIWVHLLETGSDTSKSGTTLVRRGAPAQAELLYTAMVRPVAGAEWRLPAARAARESSMVICPGEK